MYLFRPFACLRQPSVTQWHTYSFTRHTVAQTYVCVRAHVKMLKMLRC